MMGKGWGGKGALMEAMNQAYAKGWGKEKGGGRNGYGAESHGGTWNSGLQEATTEALAPFAHMDEQWTPEEMVKRVSTYIGKAASKYGKDDRIGSVGSRMQANAFVDEYVQSAMNAVSAGCYDKAWFNDAPLGLPLYAAALGTFQGTKLFSRTTAPALQQYIEESLKMWREEERIYNTMQELVTNSGLAESNVKRAVTFLRKGYDEAHLAAPYGTTTAASPELQTLQDFIKGWMKDFVRRAGDVLAAGVGEDYESQAAWVEALFSNIADPAVLCLPYDLYAAVGDSLPARPWPFISETVSEVFIQAQEQAAQRPAKWQKGASKGWGGGKGAFNGKGGGKGGKGKEGAKNPNCTNGEDCIGTEATPLGVHIQDDGSQGDVYCNACWSAINVQGDLKYMNL